MGSQRRLAEGLMEHFLLTEAEAWERIKYIEAFSLEDEMYDTVLCLVQEGDLDQCLAGLEEIIHKLANARLNLMAAFAGVKKRKE